MIRGESEPQFYSLCPFPLSPPPSLPIPLSPLHSVIKMERLTKFAEGTMGAESLRFTLCVSDSVLPLLYCMCKLML